MVDLTKTDKDTVINNKFSNLLNNPMSMADDGQMTWTADQTVKIGTNKDSQPSPGESYFGFADRDTGVAGNAHVQWTQKNEGGSAGNYLYAITIPKGSVISSTNNQIKVYLTFGDYTGEVIFQYEGYTIGYPNNGANSDKNDTHYTFAFRILKDGNANNDPMFDVLFDRFLKAFGGQPSLIGIPDDQDFNVTNQVYTDKTHLHDGSFPDHTFSCFLSGTLITTKDGLKKVEDIQIGDYVQALEGDSFTARRVININKAIILVRHNDYYPVCIKKHAFADNVPSQDLYVTSEHCLYIDGFFVPARMLVNNNSIIWDKSRDSYSIYHIETDNHSIIESNGLLSESYLDTRSKFVDANHKHFHKTWEKDAAAPLNTNSDFVKPIYDKLLNRARHLGNNFVENHCNLTKDADFHIITDTDKVIYPFAINKDKYLFHLPAHSKEIILKSRASRPYDVIGPYVDDRRYLGVLIGQINYIDSDCRKTLNTHLINEHLIGWNNIENSSCRWTKGNALLPLGESLNKQVILVIQVVDTNYYVDEADVQNSQYAMA